MEDTSRDSTHDSTYARAYGSSQSFVSAEKKRLETRRYADQIRKTKKWCQKTKSIDYNKAKSDRVRCTLCLECEEGGKDPVEDCERWADRKGRYKCVRLSDEKACRVRLYLSRERIDETSGREDDQEVELEAEIKREIKIVLTNDSGLNQNRIIARVPHSKRKVRKYLIELVEDRELVCQGLIEKGVPVKRYSISSISSRI